MAVLAKSIWINVFLILLSLPNLFGLWYDPTGTKFAALLVPIILFIGLGRLVPSFSKRVLWSLPLLIVSFCSLCILIQFNSHVTEGVIEAIVNSDTVEAYEFVKEVKLVLYFFLALYVLGFVYLYQHAKTLEHKSSINTAKTNKRLWITALLIALPIVDMLGKGASARSFPLIISKTTYTYLSEMASMEALLKKRSKFQFDASISGKPKKETFVFMIGETSRRDFYSLYGYERETNPQLSKLDNLAIFKDVISPANATVLSLMATLHLSTAEDDSLYYSTKSIVSLAKEAGYKTWWLSAQSRFGKHETNVSASGTDADVKKYIEEGRTLSRTFDTALLPFLDESLKDSKEQKFIVMHLYGSHISYSRRYPEDFALFDGSIPPNYEKHPVEVQQKVNEYGNSIAYTDLMVSQVIKSTDQLNTASCVIYTADHGEYLGDYLDDDFIGHGRGMPAKAEVEVPLVVWCSDEYKQQNQTKWNEISSNTDAAISLEDMFYSLSDLMHIDYKLMKPERSFFNAKFKPNLPRKTRASSNRKLFDYKELR